MRLTARVRDLAEMVSAESEREVGIVWTSSHARVDRAAARPGDRVVADMYIDEPAGPGPDFLPASIRLVERFTRSARDLGVVYDAAGERIGRVLSSVGGVLEWELTASSGMGGR